MLSKLKQKLRSWLFADEQVAYEARVMAMKQMQESANIVTLARQQLAGFDPALIKDREDLLSKHENEDSVNTFLEQVHELAKSEVLKEIVDDLVAEQVVYGQKNAESLQQLNFSRATVNGLQLLLEEIERYHAVYVDRTSPEEEYDPSEVI